MTWRRRALGIAVATVLLGIAATYAVRPFTKTVGFPWFVYSPLSDQETTSAPVSGHCRAAVLSAPSGGGDELRLWAVTVGDDMMGFTPVLGEESKFELLEDGTPVEDLDLPDGLCATSARERLVTAPIFLLGAGGVLFFTLRRRHHAPA